MQPIESSCTPHPFTHLPPPPGCIVCVWVTAPVLSSPPPQLPSSDLVSVSPSPDTDLPAQRLDCGEPENTNIHFLACLIAVIVENTLLGTLILETRDHQIHTMISPQEYTALPSCDDNKERKLACVRSGIHRGGVKGVGG